MKLFEEVEFTPKGKRPVGLGVELTAPVSEKKAALLAYLRSSNPNSINRYKRLPLSPIRYAGGKSLAVGYVLELLPDQVNKVVSPFFGGGSVEIALTKILGIEVVGYDIFDILVNYWKHQIQRPHDLYQALVQLSPTKDQFEEIRLRLNQVWKGELTLAPFELAVEYVYNFNLSYGPGFMGWSSDIYLNDDFYKKMIEYIRDFDAGKLSVSVGTFDQTLPRHRQDFLYLDPPYYLGEDSKMFKGIYPMRNIPVHHKGFDHELLARLLDEHEGGFILSYNDCPTIRELYADYEYSLPSWQYSMGQGETRIGQNRKGDQSDHVKQSHEILIYKPPKN